MSLVPSGWQLDQAVGQRKEEKNPNGLNIPHQKYNPNQGRGRERPLQPDQRWELAADKGSLEDSPGPSDTQGTQPGQCPSPLKSPITQRAVRGAQRRVRVVVVAIEGRAPGVRGSAPRQGWSLPGKPNDFCFANISQ